MTSPVNLPHMLTCTVGIVSCLMECDCTQSALSHPSERQQWRELGLCLYLKAPGKASQGADVTKCKFRVTPPSRPSRLCGFSVPCFIIQVSTDTLISSRESETQVGILAEHIHLRTSSAYPKSVLHEWEPPLHRGHVLTFQNPTPLQYD